MDYASSNVNMLEELALKYKLLFPEKIFLSIIFIENTERKKVCQKLKEMEQNHRF